MHNLANSYDALGRHADAFELRKKTLALNRATLGDDHPSTLSTMGTLANSYCALGRHADALKLREESLRGQKAKLGPTHPMTLLSMSNVAVSYANLGRHSEALELRKETLTQQRAKLGPDHAHTRTSVSNLADSYYALGRHAEAIATYREAVELGPKSAWAHTQLGAALARNGDLDGAVAEYRAAIELDATSSWAHGELGSALCELEDFAGGARALRIATELSPAGSGQWYQLANAYLALGQREDHRKVCGEMMERYNKTKEPDWAGRILYACLPTADALADMSALIPLTEAVANGKPDARALGAALYRTRKYDEAIVRLNAGSQDRAWDNLFLAMAHHHLGNAEEARAYLKIAVQRIEYADYPWTEHVESEALCREAEMLILGKSTNRPAITPERSTARARVRSGNTLRANGQPEAATAEYRKAIKLDPKYAPAHVFLGLALSRKGDDAGAIAAYESAREIDATIAGNELAWILATSRAASLRDPQRAVRIARETVELEPRNGSNWNTLGAAQYRAGDWKPAIAALEQSMKLQKGGDCTDWFFLAMAHKQLNERDKARRWYDQAVQWMDKHASPDQFLRALGAEAKALMQGHDPEPTKN